jgi:nucleotide-binding universal stress UspA family protein
MDRIVCATRGGEGSRAVQLAAIDRARESGDELIFLFVADSTIQDHVDAALKPAVREELLWMGNAMLQIAKQRAGVRHIDVSLVVREGDVQEEIASFLRESSASLLLLGAPRGTTETIFGDDAIEQFALKITEATGVAVEVVRPETSIGA